MSPLKKQAMPSSMHQKTATGLWLAASFADSKEKRGHGRLYTAILFAFIVVFLLLILLVGMKVYSALNDARTTSDNSRLGLALIANSVRMNDTSGAVGIGKGPEGPSLVLTEKLETRTLETRIYAYQGKIVEEYSLAENAYTPDKAREIVESSIFEFTYSNGLLSVTTDQGNVDIALHSVGGNA